MAGAVPTGIHVGGIALSRAKHQVAGHRFEDGKTGSLVDGRGHFFKPLQVGPRGIREEAFYERVLENTPRSVYEDEGSEATPSGSGGAGATDGIQLIHEVHSRLARWVPRYFGTIMLGGEGGMKHVQLDDVSGRYKKPCIIDIKMGYQTWYAGADPAYIQKCKIKDSATTSAGLGFKVCGMQVWDERQGGYWRAGKPFCKQMPVASVASVLSRFGSSGRMVPAHVFGGPGGVLPALEALLTWFEYQREYYFYSSSILIMYEGTASRAEDLNAVVKLVDFAHTFPSGGRRDSNFIGGLGSLLETLRAVAESEDGRRGVAVDGEGNWYMEGFGVVGRAAGRGALQIKKEAAAAAKGKGGIEGVKSPRQGMSSPHSTASTLSVEVSS